MPLIQKFIDLDKLYRDVPNPILLNDVPVMDDIKNYLVNKLGETFSLRPRCLCDPDEVKHMGYMVGKVCPNCGAVIEDVLDDILPRIWVRKFDDKLPFINPGFWNSVNSLLSKNIDILLYLSNTTVKLPTIRNAIPKKGRKKSISLPNYVPFLVNVIGGRGYENLLNNMDKLLESMKLLPNFNKPEKLHELDVLIDIWKNKKDSVVSSYIPIVSNKLNVVEINSTGKWINPGLSEAINAAKLAVYYSKVSKEKLRKNQLGNQTSKIINSVAKFFNTYVEKIVAKKPGLVRKQLYGMRMFFTFRTVASSGPSDMEYDEIHVPWEILCSTFKFHLINKLTSKKFRLNERVFSLTPEQALRFVLNNTKRYNPIIDKLGQELIEDARKKGYKGIPVLINRNPSLKQGSIQLLYITKFKTDILDKTTDVSLRIVKPFNLDFDGDSVNGIVLLDDKLYRLAYGLKPIYNVYALDNFKLGNGINLPETSTILIANYLRIKENNIININENEDIVVKLLEN